MVVTGVKGTNGIVYRKSNSVLQNLSLLGIMVVSISWKVWKASKENPADVIKSE
jgi:hypothetical protein